jgi:hypothetical protein
VTSIRSIVFSFTGDEIFIRVVLVHPQSIWLDKLTCNRELFETISRKLLGTNATYRISDVQRQTICVLAQLNEAGEAIVIGASNCGSIPH